MYIIIIIILHSLRTLYYLHITGTCVCVRVYIIIIIIAGNVSRELSCTEQYTDWD